MPAIDSLHDKVAIVTGSTSGIGADIARALREAGCRVVLAGIDDAAGAALAATFDDGVIYQHTDVTVDADIDACLAATQAAYGRLDILVNNACIYADKGIASTREEWLNTLNVNLVSGAVFVQKAVPFMTQPGAVIINLGSTGGKFGAAQRALYPASKAGILQLTRNEAVTLAPQGIRVLSVSPGWTWSPTLATLAGTMEHADSVAAPFHPVGRAGRGDDVGQVVAFLCSDGARFMTGVDVPVDGGFSALGPDQGLSPRHWFGSAAKAGRGGE
ncbi:SDR family oxidoreductase [Pigmentiphaga litoralis]|uniref:SDR family oxidoreductase n=1 Tax=Pigmentiphaga litoralis TaxID=516702 RepID=UPI003B430830